MQDLRSALSRVAAVTGLGLDLSTSTDLLAWHLSELCAQYNACIPSAHKEHLRECCEAVMALHSYRLVEDALTRSGPYCAAETLAELSPTGARLFPRAPALTTLASLTLPQSTGPRCRTKSG